MDDVKWIKLKVGMFDGSSFKRIRRAKIGGESYRDKLTAIWFELMDFAGKCNHNGAFVDQREIPYTDLEDIAVMIDREVDELQLCMSFYVKEGMVEIIDDVYKLTNWAEYQNEEALEQIRENKRLRQARWREKKRMEMSFAETPNVSLEPPNVSVDATVDATQPSTERLPSYSNISNITSCVDSKEEGIRGCGGEGKPTGKPAWRSERHKYGQNGLVQQSSEEYGRLVRDYGQAEADRCIAYVDELAQSTGNKNGWKDWNLVVRRCHRDGWGRKAQPAKKGSDGNIFLEMLNKRRDNNDPR